MKSLPPCSPALVAGLAALLLAGCLNTKPVSDPTRYYVLSAPAPAAASGEGRTDGMVIGLNPVTLPSYVRDKRLAVRKGGSEVEYLTYHCWAERLESGVGRVLRQNLEGRTPVRTVCPAPWRRDLVQLELSVSFARCDLMDDGRVLVEARWHSGKPGATEGLRWGEARIERDGPPPGTNPAGAVTALSGALAELSARIAADLTARR